MLPMRARFPFNTRDNPGYAFAAAYQVYQCYLILSIILFMDVLGFTTINQVGIHMQELVIKYTNLGSNRSSFKSDRQFQKYMLKEVTQFIIDHQTIMELNCFFFFILY